MQQALSSQALSSQALSSQALSSQAPSSQAQTAPEIAELTNDSQREGAEENQPRLDYAPYRSSLLRHPTKDLHHADPESIELFAPVFGHRDLGLPESDLTIQHTGEPVGERIAITGRVLDGLTGVLDGQVGLR